MGVPEGGGACGHNRSRADPHFRYKAHKRRTKFKVSHVVRLIGKAEGASPTLTRRNEPIHIIWGRPPRIFFDQAWRAILCGNDLNTLSPIAAAVNGPIQAGDIFWRCIDMGTGGFGARQNFSLLLGNVLRTGRCAASQKQNRNHRDDALHDMAPCQGTGGQDSHQSGRLSTLRRSQKGNLCLSVPRPPRKFKLRHHLGMTRT